jgi:hypothetical protein
MATASIEMVKSDNFLLGLTITVVITFGSYATSAVPRVIWLLSLLLFLLDPLFRFVTFVRFLKEVEVLSFIKEESNYNLELQKENWH